MGKTFKRIIAATAAALTVGTFSIGAAAATDGTSTADYVGYVGFGPFYLGDKGKSQPTDPVQKHDAFNYCAVYIEGGTVSTTSPVYFGVYNSDGQSAAPGASATQFNILDDNYNSIKLYYYDGMGVVGEYYTLHLNSGYNGVTVSGKWAP